MGLGSGCRARSPPRCRAPLPGRWPAPLAPAPGDHPAGARACWNPCATICQRPARWPQCSRRRSSGLASQLRGPPTPDSACLADRTWMSSAAMLTAISSGVSAPMERPIGACTRARSSAENPSSPRSAIGLRDLAPATYHAYVRRGSPEGLRKHGLVVRVAPRDDDQIAVLVDVQGRDHPFERRRHLYAVGSRKALLVSRTGAGRR